MSQSEFWFFWADVTCSGTSLWPKKYNLWRRGSSGSHLRRFCDVQTSFLQHFWTDTLHRVPFLYPLLTNESHFQKKLIAEGSRHLLANAVAKWYHRTIFSWRRWMLLGVILSGNHTKNYAAHAWHVWLLGRSGFSSPSSKEQRYCQIESRHP